VERSEAELREVGTRYLRRSGQGVRRSQHNRFHGKICSRIPNAKAAQIAPRGFE